MELVLAAERLAQVCREVELSVEVRDVLRPFGVGPVQPGRDALAQQSGQSRRQEIDYLHPGPFTGTVLHQGQRTQRVKQVKQVLDGNLRADDDPAARCADDADVARGG